MAEVENLMTSTERIIEYGKLEPEAALETTNGICLIQLNNRKPEKILFISLSLVRKLNNLQVVKYSCR